MFFDFNLIGSPINSNQQEVWGCYWDARSNWRDSVGMYLCHILKVVSNFIMLICTIEWKQMWNTVKIHLWWKECLPLLLIYSICDPEFCLKFAFFSWFNFFVLTTHSRRWGGYREILQVTASNFSYGLSRTKSLHSQLVCTVASFSTIFVIQYNSFLMLHNTFKYENIYWDDRYERSITFILGLTILYLFALTQGMIMVPEKLILFVMS